MNDLKKLADAITAALRSCPTADVLSVLTGSFVSLTIELVRRSGNDADKEVKIDGGKMRDITIHALKNTTKKATP